MNAKDAIKALSERLDPARRQFAIRLYKRSARLVETQAYDSASLFWQLPNHVLANLERLLGSNTTKLRCFFKEAHARRHHIARTALGKSVANEINNFEEILTSAYQPTLAQMRNGLVLPSDPLARLNQAKLVRSIAQEGQELFRHKELPDPNERGTHRFRVDMHPWYVRVTVEFARVFSQASVECNACIGLGPLSLERQLCLYSILGIGPQGCDLAEPGQEAQVAKVLVT